MNFIITFKVAPRCYGCNERAALILNNVYSTVHKQVF